jgi:hypothetical protein
MSRFPSEQAFVSWPGLTPSRDVSGCKVVRAVRRKVSSRAAQTLRLGAITPRCSNSYLGARYRHLQKQLPSKASAVKAMARYLGVLVYRLLTKGQTWVDRGRRGSSKDARLQIWPRSRPGLTPTDAG